MVCLAATAVLDRTAAFLDVSSLNLAAGFPAVFFCLLACVLGCECGLVLQAIFELAR